MNCKWCELSREEYIQLTGGTLVLFRVGCGAAFLMGVYNGYKGNA